MSQLIYIYHTDSGAELEIEANYVAVCDPNYGADADGNRGIECWSLDDFAIEIYDEEVNVTKMFSIARPTEYMQIFSDAADKCLDIAASKDPEFYEEDDDDQGLS